MRPQLTKRACDECISRKVKCSGAWPCQTCQNGTKRVRCTYLKPARRRGPKVRRRADRGQETPGILSSHGAANGADPPAETRQDSLETEHEPAAENVSGGSVVSRWMVPPSILISVVCMYRQCSYSVWPVVNAEALLRRIESGRYDLSTYCLATALCAATMAQLQLGPVGDENGDGGLVDCAAMATECMRVREKTGYRENPDLRSVFVSFFLHVYHAKINKRNSAMMFIQEAISAARLLRLDLEELLVRRRSPDEDVIENDEILFVLLWVSERGYAIHLGMAPSYTEPIQIPNVPTMIGNVHVQGLVELARLFATFDRLSMRRRHAGRNNQAAISIDHLAETEATLSTLSLSCRNEASSRMADHCITKEWMRTIVWQEALSRQLLSTTSYAELMTFKFPALVSRDLLYSLREFTESDLLPLGRDQLLKCFEVANSLADIVLFTPSSSIISFQLRPEDYLHALYQKLLPFLDQDPMLKSILRAKTAEALLLAPARLPEIGWWEDMLQDENTDGHSDNLAQD